MELGDLKGAWQKQTGPSAIQLLDENELLLLLRKKATNAIDALKRSVRFELWFTLVFMLACIVVWLVKKDEVIRNASLVTAILSAGFGFYYYKKLSLLTTLHIENSSIKENLHSFITQFEKFLWMYRWGYNILVPVALVAGAFLGMRAAAQADVPDLISQPKLWIVLVLVFVPLILVLNYGMKWYLQKLYGNHLLRLRSIMADLED